MDLDEAQRVAQVAARAAELLQVAETADAAGADLYMPTAAGEPIADGEVRRWCPKLGASCVSCACGTPQGAECDHLQRDGKGGRGQTSGAARTSKKAIAEAAARSLMAHALAAEAVTALAIVAGDLADVALSLARHGGWEEVAVILVAMSGGDLIYEPIERGRAQAQAYPPRRTRRGGAQEPPAEVAAAARAAGRAAGVAFGWARVAAAVVAQEVRETGAAGAAIVADVRGAVAEVRAEVARPQGRHARGMNRPAPQVA